MESLSRLQNAAAYARIASAAKDCACPPELMRRRGMQSDGRLKMEDRRLKS
jgi:hypothetical protein